MQRFGNISRVDRFPFVKISDRPRYAQNSVMRELKGRAFQSLTEERAAASRTAEFADNSGPSDALISRPVRLLYDAFWHIRGAADSSLITHDVSPFELLAYRRASPADLDLYIYAVKERPADLRQVRRDVLARHVHFLRRMSEISAVAWFIAQTSMKSAGKVDAPARSGDGILPFRALAQDFRGIFWHIQAAHPKIERRCGR